MTARKPQNAANAAARERKRHIPRHGAFFVGAAVGVVALLVGFWLTPKYAVGIGANAMFITYLALVALMMRRMTPEFLRDRADEADTPVGYILLVVAAVVAVSFYGLFTALNGGDAPAVGEVILSVVSVLLGWFAIHTMAAFHYAYEYYESESASPGKSTAGKGHAGKVVGGLNFPEGDNPDGVAFLYFAYVLGTAFAVSDIQVTSNKMRKLVMVHSTFAYFFNTLIVAATVNVAVAVGGN